MILGVDPGARRIGLAIADEGIRLATPLEVVDASVVDPVERIAEVVADRNVTLVVVGHPVGLSGREGPAVDVQRDFVTRLRGELGILVVEHDERLTTVIAERRLRAAGSRSKARRAVRDAVAAQVMLQGYLDTESGR